MTAIPKIRLLRVYPPSKDHPNRGVRYDIDGVDKMTVPGDVLAFDPVTGAAAEPDAPGATRWRVLTDGCLHPLSEGG